jgi:hypothetical protein
MLDYAALNEHKTTNHALDNEVSPYDEGYADGLEGLQADHTLRNKLTYRQGYVRGLVASMRTIAARQRAYVDPSTGFDWF